MFLQQSLSGYQVTLRSIGVDDLELLRKWRNSEPVKRHMLTMDEISNEQQRAWFQYITRAKNQLHFVIEYGNKPIGSCNIKCRGPSADIKESDYYELGLYIGDQQYAGNLIAFAPTLVMNDYCFKQLSAKALHAVVKSENTAALRYNEKLGYTVERSGPLYELVLTQDRYEDATAVIKQLLSRPKRKAKNR